MEKHVIAAELSATGAQELLETTSLGHLAYTAEDGTPRVVPIGFYWTGTEFVISTATTSPKVAALQAHPDIALVIDRGDTPGQARSLSVRGRANVEIVDGVVPEFLAARASRWTPRRPPSSRRTAVRPTTRWRASRSSRAGCVSTTSVRGGCRSS